MLFRSTINNLNPLSTYTYTWLKDTSPAVFGTTSALNAIGDGTYTVTVEESGTGCVSLPVSGTVLPVVVLPQITLDPTPSTNCISPLTLDGAPRNGNGTIQATVTQATDFKVEWYDASNTLITVAANPSADQTLLKYLQGGINSLFTVKVLNNLNGCVNTATALVSEPPRPKVVTRPVSAWMP